MTVKSWPWAGHTQGDAVYAPYTNKWFADFFQLFLVYDRRYEVIVDTGHQSFTGGLQVNDTGGDVTVQTGVGIVDGMMFTSDAPIVLTPDDTPSIRTDLVIARKNITGPGTPQTVDILLLKGTNGNNTPPALTQNTTTWEVALAEVDLTPGPAIDAVRNTGRIVRTPLGPGYQYDSLDLTDSAHAASTWVDVGTGVQVTVGPGSWMVSAALAVKAQVASATRFARIYDNTLGQVVAWGLAYMVATEGGTIHIPLTPYDVGVVTQLKLQFYTLSTTDDVYGDNAGEGPGATSLTATRVV